MATIRNHEQLIVWQLGQQISQRVAEIMRRSAAGADRNYCSELQEAADAISANIAEGFDRYRLPQFRYFLEIANGSLGETSTRIRQGFARRLFSERDFNELMLLCRRTRKLLAPLIVSVEAQGQGNGKPSTQARTRRRQLQKNATAKPPKDPLAKCRGPKGAVSQDPTAKSLKDPTAKSPKDPSA
jgi:four helix bundle protein